MINAPASFMRMGFADEEPQHIPGRVVVIDRPGPYRRAMEIVLKDAGIDVVCADRPVEEHGDAVEGAIVNGTWTDGLTYPELHARVRHLSEQVPTVVLLPHSWARMLDEQQVGQAVILARPFVPEALLMALDRAGREHAGRSTDAGR